MTLHSVLCTLDVVLLVVAVGVAWRAPWRGACRDAVAGVAFAGIAFLAAWLATRSWGPFAVLRACCHALFCVLLPGFAVRAVVVSRQAPKLAAAVLVAVLAGEGCYVWAIEVEPFRLEVTTTRITSRRVDTLQRPLRIAAIADLQPENIGAYEVSVFDALVAERPDLVLFLGDYLQQHGGEAFERQRILLQSQLRRLAPPLGMYAVDGDMEWRGAAAVFAGTEVRVLVDSHAELAGVPIDIVGLSRQRSRRTAADVGLVRRLGTDRFCIVIGHAPDYMRSVLDGGLQADALFLAGHTHGGQVQVPGFGPLVTLSSVPRWLAGGGVFRRGDTWLAVSRGIGMERDLAPRIRFWCRPQLLMLELTGRRDHADRTDTTVDGTFLDHK